MHGGWLTTIHSFRSAADHLRRARAKRRPHSRAISKSLKIHTHAAAVSSGAGNVAHGGCRAASMRIAELAKVGDAGGIEVPGVKLDDLFDDDNEDRRHEARRRRARACGSARRRKHVCGETHSRLRVRRASRVSDRRHHVVRRSRLHRVSHHATALAIRSLVDPRIPHEKSRVASRQELYRDGR